MDSVGFMGVTFGIVGGFAYFFYHRSHRCLDRLENIPQYSSVNDLKQKVEELGSLPYVAVTGKVSADGQVINGRFNKQVQGVIQMVELKEHRSERRNASNNWSNDSRTLSCNWNTEPFSLISSSTSENQNVRLHVTNPLNAEELNLSVVYDEYEPIKSSVAESLLNYATGQHVKGIETIEKMLITNTTLTAVGEIFINTNGHLTIRAPSISGTRYILSTASIESLFESQQSSVFAWKVIAFSFLALSGVYLSYWYYKRYIVKYIERKRYERLLADLHSGVDDDTDDTRCVICLERPRNVVILHCGHVYTCKQCTEQLKKCPICRKNIDRLVPIFH